MGAAVGTATVVRFPPRLRAVPKSESPSSALDALLSAGTIDGRQHAAGVAWAAFHRRFDQVARTSWSGHIAALPTRAWKTLKAERAVLVAAAGFDRFLLDRLCLDGESPLRCEVGRVRAALERVAGLSLACPSSASLSGPSRSPRVS